MKSKVLYSLLCLVFVLAGTARAEEELRDVQARPVYQDGGNSPRDISVPLSSTSIVLISSTAVDAVSQTTDTVDLGIMEYRYREIVNCSTTSALRLYWTSDFKTYSSSGGIVLSSDPAGGGKGDSYLVPHQGAVWGMHSPYGIKCLNCAGVCGAESYWSLAPDIKKRR